MVAETVSIVGSGGQKDTHKLTNTYKINIVTWC